MNFFYETPVHLLFKPITDLPGIESGRSPSPPSLLPTETQVILVIELIGSQVPRQNYLDIVYPSSSC